MSALAQVEDHYVLHLACSGSDLISDVATGLRLNDHCQLVLLAFLHRDTPEASVGEPATRLASADFDVS